MFLTVNDEFRILHDRFSPSFMSANAVVDSHYACVRKVFRFYEHVISFHECNRAEYSEQRRNVDKSYHSAVYRICLYSILCRAYIIQLWK